jgi:putative proteasome-type protease
MTYCVGVLLEGGMVFASDSRASAGIDQGSSCRKMAFYERADDRVINVMSAGNLSLTRSAIDMLAQHAKDSSDGLNLWTAQSMFEVAALLGDCLRAVKRGNVAHRAPGLAPHLEQNHVDSHASFIIGGQIQGEQQRLFLVYAEGNFIEATPETPFFQIGETKYGKPIIDRVIIPGLSLGDAIKCVLISFDSTMRSNPLVGLPIDLCVVHKDTLRIGSHRQITETDPYFGTLHEQWGEGLRRIFTQLPEPQWEAKEV